jgi:hypothetical protein
MKTILDEVMEQTGREKRTAKGIKDYRDIDFLAERLSSCVSDTQKYSKKIESKFMRMKLSPNDMRDISDMQELVNQQLNLTREFVKLCRTTNSRY